MYMDNDQKKAVRFTDLEVWRKGHEIVLLIYRHTKTFPREELFGMTSQMRRAAVSITSNISEGFGRRTLPDKSHFYSMALGSVYELTNQVIISHDLGYVSADIFSELTSRCTVVAKMLNKLNTSLREARRS